jgi:isopentenyl diphosphate isomerase/L-lactate dehydrogenase-like FMN-dependent dehydrogenase
MEPINVSEYEALARERIEAGVWAFYQGGSDDEVTLRANRSAFERIRLRPRVLVDVSSIDMGTTMLGTPVRMPIAVAPSASHAAAHPEGELATAHGAMVAGALMIASTVSNYPLEEIANAARAAGGYTGEAPLWFQLYMYEDTSLTVDLVQRAQAAGYRAIVLTVDLPRLGNREWDKRHNKLNPGPPQGYRAGNFKTGTDGDGSPFNQRLTWKTVDWLRGITPLPIVLKGILTAEDAALAVQHGVAGIVVSNHGGRQLDGVPATIEALPEVTAAVEQAGGKCEVYLDGGVRRGTDVLKALALGARAVLVGRPILWGLAVNGSAGVTSVLEILRSELELDMALAGRPTVASIDRTLVRLP